MRGREGEEVELLFGGGGLGGRGGGGHFGGVVVRCGGGGGGGCMGDGGWGRGVMSCGIWGSGECGWVLVRGGDGVGTECLDRGGFGPVKENSWRGWGRGIDDINGMMGHRWICTSESMGSSMCSFIRGSFSRKFSMTWDPIRFPDYFKGFFPFNRPLPKAFHFASSCLCT